MLAVALACAASLAAAEPAEPIEERIARLVRELGDNDYVVRERAQRTLEEIGERARTRLEEAARSEDREVAWRAAEVLRGLKWRPTPALRARLGPGAERLARYPELGEQGRMAVVQLLSERGGDEAEPYLIAAAGDEESPWIRARAVGALAPFRSAKAFAAVRRAAADGDDEGAVVSAATRALGSFPGPEAAALLAKLAREGAENLRIEAIEALGRRADARHAPLLRDALAGRDRAAIAAARALGRLRDRGALPALIEMLADAAWRQREAAANALGRVAGAADREVRDALAARLDDDFPRVQEAAIRALIVMRAPGSAAKVLRLAADRRADRPVRLAAVRYAAACGGRAVAPLLAARLETDEEEMAAAYAEALLWLGKREKAERRLGAILDRSTNPDAVLRAAEALARYGAPGAAKRLAASKGAGRSAFTQERGLWLRAVELGDDGAFAELARTLAGDASGLARLAIARGLGDVGLEEARRQAEARPHDLHALDALALGLMQIGRYAGAEAAFERAVRADPFSASAKNNLAWLHASATDGAFRKPAKAAALAREADRLDPKSSYVQDTLGWALVRAGRTEEGTRILLDAAARAGPGDPMNAAGSFARAAQGYAVLDRAGKARELLARIGRLGPARGEPGVETACAWCTLGEREKALACLESVARFGWADARPIERREALAPLRGEERFARVLEDVRRRERSLRAVLRARLPERDEPGEP